MCIWTRSLLVNQNPTIKVLETYRLGLEPDPKVIERPVNVHFHRNDILQAVDAISIQFLL